MIGKIHNQGVRTVLAVMAIAMMSALPAQAVPIAVNAFQAESPASTFELSFSGNALPESFISNTAFTLEVDDEPLGTGAARFLSYSQSIDPLTLPDGQGGYVNTGQLTVEIVSGSNGISAYNPLTGEFTTTETYRIHYTGNLTAIGLENGGFVDFDSTSVGFLTFDKDDPSRGIVAQNWAGFYSPLGLDYACTVHATFPEPAALSLLGVALLAFRRSRTR